MISPSSSYSYSTICQPSSSRKKKRKANKNCQKREISPSFFSDRQSGKRGIVGRRRKKSPCRPLSEPTPYTLLFLACISLGFSPVSIPLGGLEGEKKERRKNRVICSLIAKNLDSILLFVLPNHEKLFKHLLSAFLRIAKMGKRKITTIS